MVASPAVARSTALVILSWTAGCATAGGAGPPPFSADQVVDRQALTGPEGVEITVIQTKDQALVELVGVGGDLEGAVLSAELTGTLSKRRYETTIDGRTRGLLIRDDQSWTLYASTGGPLTVVPDPTRTAAIDPDDLLSRHLRQKASGRLDELAIFDRDGAQRKGEEVLAKELEGVVEACGFDELPTAIDWTGTSDEQLMRYSVGSYCAAPESALKRACEYDASQTWLRENVERFECRFGEALSWSLDDGTLRYVVDFETPNQAQWARDAMDGWTIRGGRTVRDVRIQARTAVCADPARERFVMLGPREDEATGGVAYGDASRLWRQPERPYLPDGWFFEPRFRNPQNNSSFRGYDLRHYSRLEVDEETGACRLVCGTRTVDLEPIEGEEKTTFLDTARLEPIADAREPYALARDKRGVYYYVDRGALPETERDFRLYVGPPGNPRRQQMTDIVSDSEGEIFASKSGDLKLYLGKDEAEWVTRRRKRRLLRVPIEENYDLIYNRLGVYLGEKLHTPCDDF